MQFENGQVWVSAAREHLRDLVCTISETNGGMEDGCSGALEDAAVLEESNLGVVGGGGRPPSERFRKECWRGVPTGLTCMNGASSGLLVLEVRLVEGFAVAFGENASEADVGDEEGFSARVSLCSSFLGGFVETALCSGGVVGGVDSLVEDISAESAPLIQPLYACLSIGTGFGCRTSALKQSIFGSPE